MYYVGLLIASFIFGDLVDRYVRILILFCLHKLPIVQWFPTGEEFLPREAFHEFRGGMSTS